MTDADKKPFLQAFAKLCVSLREKEPDVAQVRVYFKALSDLDVELVLMAATALEKTAQWFPKTSEWRDAAKKLDRDRAAEQRRAIQQRLVAGMAPLCLGCDDTGWDRTDKGVTRCACHLTRRLEVLGRRPMPELPNSKPSPNLGQLARVNKLLEAVKPMPAAGVYLQTEPHDV